MDRETLDVAKSGKNVTRHEVIYLIYVSMLYSGFGWLKLARELAIRANLKEKLFLLLLFIIYYLQYY